MTTKTCTKCHETKPETEFRKYARNRDGLSSACAACTKITDGKYRAENSEKVLSNKAKHRAVPGNREKESAVNAKWAADNPEARRASVQNYQARKRESGGKLSKGLAARLFDLQKGRCPCCGKPLGNDYHLDHRMPIKLGGVNNDSNIQLLRAACNNQKGAKHPVDFMQQRGFLL